MTALYVGQVVNTSVVFYGNHQSGVYSWDLWLEAKSLFLQVQELSMTLRAVHLQGKTNVLADSLSRADLNPQEYKL